MILVDDKKRGRTIARIDGSTLTFEQAGLGQETLDEIIMTAVALADHARRHSKNADVVDLSGSIADLVGGTGGGGVCDVGGGGGGGGGGDGGGGGGGGPC